MDTLKKISDIKCPTGLENAMAHFILHEVSNYISEIYVDDLGNLIAHRALDDAEKVVVECGMDQASLMVVAKQDGKIWFNASGFMNPDSLVNKVVILPTGAVEIIRCDKNHSDGIEVSDLYIETQQALDVGDFICIKSDLMDNEKCFMSNDISHKVAIYVLINVIKSLKICNKDLYFVFSARKQIMSQGAKAAVAAVAPHLILSINSVSAEKSIKFGEGCAIFVKDKSGMASLVIKDKLRDLANKNNISHQFCLTDDKSDIGSYEVKGKGSLCGGIFIPVKYKNQGMEAVSKDDVLSATKLLLEFLR